jgi:hypothetical protein
MVFGNAPWERRIVEDYERRCMINPNSDPRYRELSNQEKFELASHPWRCSPRDKDKKATTS